MPAATGMRTAILLALQVPIFMPSAEQTDCPAVVQGIEPAAALLPVESDEAEPEEEAVSVAAGTAGLGVPIADPVAIGIIDGAALDLAAPGAPGGGIATTDIEGDAAPEGEDEPDPISEPSPVTVGIPELPAEPVGAEPDAPDEGEAPELPESAGPAAAALQLPTGGVSSEPPLWVLGPGLGNLREAFFSSVAHPLPILATNISGKAASRFNMLCESRSSVMVVLS